MTRSKAEGLRTVEAYLALPYTLRITPDPHGGYVGVVEELPGCITQAEGWDEIGVMLRDAMRAWIAVALEDGRPVPLPAEGRNPARFLLRLPQTLYHDLQRAAEREGVSLNQYLVYRLTVEAEQQAHGRVSSVWPESEHSARRAARDQPALQR